MSNTCFWSRPLNPYRCQQACAGNLAEESCTALDSLDLSSAPTCLRIACRSSDRRSTVPAHFMPSQLASHGASPPFLFFQLAPILLKVVSKPPSSASPEYLPPVPAQSEPDRIELRVTTRSRAGATCTCPGGLHPQLVAPTKLDCTGSSCVRAAGGGPTFSICRRDSSPLFGLLFLPTSSSIITNALLLPLCINRLLFFGTTHCYQESLLHHAFHHPAPRGSAAAGVHLGEAL
jgi:hypothetical protein